ncbi:MAG: peptidoglycan bridge formation glycyltransferase FemA/FemB family protein [Candidatus Komeilibacteria bacterium]|nr:peptidoglycan bridge formation glycyltransferase FemA/FemB family protein [Candidatus Komeilibacteria bacterium]
MAETSIKFSFITDQKIWQDFVCATEFFTFLHSWEWGSLQDGLGEKIFRVGLFKNDQLQSVALLIKIKARRGTYLLCPHGPLFKRGIKPETLFNNWSKYLKDLGKTESADFIRLASVLPNTLESVKLLKDQGFIFAPMHQHTETTWVLDLNRSEKELFSQMRKTTRYLIKRAEKEGVLIQSASSQEDIQKFCQLHLRHSQKTGYEPFSQKFIAQLFKSFPADQISLKFALYENQIDAASVIIYYGQTAAYYLAVADTKHSKFSPAYLLQWQSIIEAKNKDCTSYNFWGISPDSNPKHPLAGVSLFKQGFGGEVRDLLHAYDYPLTKKYYLNWLVETFRRIKRGYYYIKPKS